MTSGGVSSELPKEQIAVSPTVIHKGWRIPFLPVSINQLYAINFSKRCVYMTNDARTFKSKAKMFITPYTITSTDKLKFHMDVHTDFYFKNGKQKKSDIQNLIKVVVDAVSERLGFDDCQIWSFSASKIQSTENYCWVELEKINAPSINVEKV